MTLISVIIGKILQVSMNEKNFLNHLGKKISEARKKKKLTQEQLSALCSLKRSYISDIERGRRNVCIKNLLKISNTLELNISLEKE